jgi:hypothetical protein
MHQFGAHRSNNESDSTNLVRWKSRKAPPTLWAEPRYKERMGWLGGENRESEERPCQSGVTACAVGPSEFAPPVTVRLRCKVRR